MKTDNSKSQAGTWPKKTATAGNLKAQVAIGKPSVSARNLRGQVATEFFMYTSVFMFIVIAAYVIVSQMQSTEIPQRENLIAKDTGEIFASAINLAVKGGFGFTYNYTFPTTILGAPYSLSFSPGKQVMILDWEGRYGVFSQSYLLPGYTYAFPDTGDRSKQCISQYSSPIAGETVYVLNSSQCSNVLTLYNDGEKLMVIHNA